MTSNSTLHMSVSASLRPVDACPHCGKQLPRVRRAETWVEQRVEGAWIAAYRLMVKAGRPLVAEVRLFPDTSRSRGAGRWNKEASSVPSEGVPGRAIGRLRLAVPLHHFRAFSRKILRDPTLAEQLLRSHGIPFATEIARRRPGRAGRPDSFYLGWAVAYVDRLAAGSLSPIRDLAADPPEEITGYVSDGRTVSEATVRDLIHQARTRGLLTRSPIGRAGGELTPKAEQLLRDGGKPPGP